MLYLKLAKMRKFALCLLVALVACSLPATSIAGSIPAVCSACRAIGVGLRDLGGK